MKKGTLSIYNHNGLVCNLLFNGKSYRLKTRMITYTGEKISLNKVSVEFEMERGKIIRIIYDGVEIYNIPIAKAPYNFIELNENETFIDIDFQSSNIYHLQKDDFYNGYIDIIARNETAVFVRGTVDNNLNSQSYFKNSKGEPVRIDNYKPANNLGLPGSSFRGMLRNLMEITSFGKFGSFNDDVLYFRSFADDCKNLRDYYNENMGSAVANIKAGLMYKAGKGYKLIPNGIATKITRTYSQVQYFQRVSTGRYIVHSGNIQGKLYDIEISCPEIKANAIDIPPSDIHSYAYDKNRSNMTINILSEAENNDFVPCFYFINNGNIVFGHTRFFRMPYLYSISSSIYPELIDNRNTDMVNTMFGDTSHSSKLFFEDLRMITGNEDEISTPKILSSPNPTSVQLYLEQGNKDIEHLNHYDSKDAIIRGNKLYWHKSENDSWKENGNQNQLINNIRNGNDKIHTIIKPIKSGATFKGRIRFENLSSIELGALLFALKLKEGYCHKIGMCKPLGLGSINIQPSLHLSDRKKRYESLSTEWGEIDAITDKSIISELINKFTDAVWEVVDNSSKGKDLWLHPRLKQLGILLDWKNKPADSLTKYMNLPDFKHRMVLPTPDIVIK